MSKALEYTKEIVVARLSNPSVSATKDGGQAIAEFFEEIYRKISEIEKSEN